MAHQLINFSCASKSLNFRGLEIWSRPWFLSGPLWAGATTGWTTVSCWGAPVEKWIFPARKEMSCGHWADELWAFKGCWNGGRSDQVQLSKDCFELFLIENDQSFTGVEWDSLSTVRGHKIYRSLAEPLWIIIKQGFLEADQLSCLREFLIMVKLRRQGYILPRYVEPSTIGTRKPLWWTKVGLRLSKPIITLSGGHSEVLRMSILG